MPRWVPTEEWKGEDVYLIGGGPSLRSFDWGLIAGKRTIGCNSAYILGAAIVKIVLFADQPWWDEIGKDGTASYGGRVVGVQDPSTNLLEHRPWLLILDRVEGPALTGPGSKGVVAKNSGLAALNLALLLGAQRVYLLGYDMQMTEKERPNWHDVRHQQGNKDVYKRFIGEFRRASVLVKKLWPGREVWNVSDVSKLDCFPRVGLREHFGGKP